MSTDPDRSLPAILAAAEQAEQRACDLLTVKEYAALMRVHPETVKRWCRKRLIPAEQVGRKGHWRIKHRAA